MEYSFDEEPKIFLSGIFKMSQYILNAIIFINLFIPIYKYESVKDIVVPFAIIIFGIFAYNKIKIYSVGYNKLIDLYKFYKNKSKSEEIILKNKEFYSITEPYLKYLITCLILSILFNTVYFII